MKLLLSIIILFVANTALAATSAFTEHNVLYIAKNNPTLIVDSTAKQQSFLNAYKRILKNDKLVITFKNKSGGSNQAFTIPEDNPYAWTVFSENLTAYDLDSSGDLDLSESVLLLMDVFQSQYKLHPEEYESLREKVIDRLEAKNQVYHLTAVSQSLLWKTFAIESDEVVALSYWGKDPLYLPKSFIYRSLRLENPMVRFADRKNGVTAILLSANGRYECPDSEILCESNMLIKLRYLHGEGRLEFVEMGAIR